MAFDLSTAKPVGGFDLATAKAVEGKEPPGWGEALMSIPFGGAKQIAHGAEAAFDFLSHPSEQPGKIFRTAAALPGAIVDEAKEGLQYVRNLSPKEFQGSAPELAQVDPNRHPWLETTQGRTGPLRQYIADKPFNAAADIAGVAGMTGAGRRVLGRGVDLAKDVAGRRVLRAIQDMTPEVRAQRALFESARDNAGVHPNVLAAELEGHQGAVPGVPLTAAQATQNAALAELEKRSRSTGGQGAGWTNFDTAQNTGMFNALSDVVGGADEAAIRRARGVRDVASGNAREASYALANQGSLEPLGGFDNPHGANYPETFSAPIRGIARGQANLPGPRANPSVHRVADYVGENLDPNLPGGPRAEDVHEIRKRISSGLNQRFGVSPSGIDADILSADVSARRVKSGIDNTLSRATGGVWDQFLDAFRAGSGPVKNVEALNDIREALATRVGGVGANDLLGNPKMTRAYITQLIERHANDKYGPRIDAATMDRLNAIRTTAQDIEAPLANYRAGVTGTGGTDTAATLLGIAGQHGASLLGARTPLHIVTSLARGARNIGAERGATRLAELLRNPPEAGNALRRGAERDAYRRRRNSGVEAAALAAALAAQPNTSE